MSQNLRNATTMRLGSLLLSTALAACTVGPDFCTPKTELAPFHNQVDASTPQAHPAPPLDRWWTGFNDPMLGTVVQRALICWSVHRRRPVGEIDSFNASVPRLQLPANGEVDGLEMRLGNERDPTRPMPARC
jgi:hypothetical protein